MDYVVAMVTRRGLMSLDGAVQDTEFLLSTWSTFRRWLREEGLDTTEGMVTFEALNKLEVIIVLLHKLNTKLKVLTGKDTTLHQTEYMSSRCLLNLNIWFSETFGFEFE